MANFFKVSAGMGIFFLAYLIVLVLQYVGEAILGVLPSSMEWIAQIGWFAMFIIYVVGMLVLPVAFAVSGAQEEPNPDSNKILEITKAVLFLTVVLAVTVKGWYIVPAMASIIDSVMLKGTFWISSIIMYCVVQVLAPISHIVTVYQNN